METRSKKNNESGTYDILVTFRHHIDIYVEARSSEHKNDENAVATDVGNAIASNTGLRLQLARQTVSKVKRVVTSRSKPPHDAKLLPPSWAYGISFDRFQTGSDDNKAQLLVYKFLDPPAILRSGQFQKFVFGWVTPIRWVLKVCEFEQIEDDAVITAGLEGTWDIYVKKDTHLEIIVEHTSRVSMIGSHDGEEILVYIEIGTQE